MTTSITGNMLDLYTRMFSDIIEPEMDQHGSVLRATCSVESGLSGDKIYFTRMGSVDGVSEHTTRFADRTIDQTVQERRIVSPVSLTKTLGFDSLDALRSAANPQSDMVRQLVEGMGRREDSVIINAISGTAAREVGGAVSNATFTAGNTIAVNVNTGTALTGDTGLHEGKLEVIKRAMGANHVDMNREKIFVVTTYKQLMNLLSRLKLLGVARSDFMARTPLMQMGLEPALDGFMGFTYLQYESVGVDANSDEYCYVFPQSAIKLGIWKPLELTIYQDQRKEANPIIMGADTTIGAVRMDEAKVFRVACDPS